MRISVFGLGYVGCVSAACLAKAGHQVIGVELQPEKVALVNSGTAPFVEPGLADLIAEQVRAGALAATTDAQTAIERTEMSLVCVGTPSLPTGQLDATALHSVCSQIGSALRGTSDRHTIVIRSTVLPGTLRTCADLIEQASGRSCGRDFVVAVNPEFLREGSALHDFWHPPFTVIGAPTRQDAERIAEIYRSVDAPVVLTSPATAQMVKYASNLFHATKIVFANEVGRLARALSIDSHEVMDVFLRDTKLNVSSAYLRPGYAYGGSCLPKDLNAITAFARENHVPIPLLERLHESNRQQIELGIQAVLDTGTEKVGVLGFSFKPNTDDLRESPHVALVETLVGKGKHVRIFDPNIRFARLMGANKRFIDAAIPHVVSLLTDALDDVVVESECIVIANRDPAYVPVLQQARPDQTIVDLVRIAPAIDTAARYIGLAW
jgi:GDP-mannose 6-dehydrogenase